MRVPAGAWDPGRTSIRDPQPWRLAGGIAFIALVLALGVHVIVLQRFANSGDENAYLWQATAFAEGAVTGASPQPQEAFRLSHIGDVEGKRFSKYPPGWPLLLSLGVMIGAPGVVNPLLAALAIAGIYRLGCSWSGRRAALLGSLVVLATPFFLLNAGSFHSHPSCLFALTTLALCLTWADERGGVWALVLAGACFGLAVLIRPFTGMLIGLPLLIAFAPALLRRTGAWRFTAAFGLGGAPFAVFLGMVNTAVTGSWSKLAWNHYDAAEVLGFGSYEHTLWQGVKTMVRLGAEGVIYTCAVGVVLALVAWARPFPRRRLTWILLLAPIAGHVFWWSHGGNRYGPRFYFEALLPFALLSGVGLERVLGWSRAREWLCAGALVWTTIGSVLLVHAYRQVHARRDVFRVVEAAGISDALVLLTTASGDMVRVDLTRNPPDFARAPVLFALAGESLNEELIEAFPHRSVYLYRWTPEGGVLSPFRR